MQVTAEVDYSIHRNIGVITVDSPPVNALGPGVRDGIHSALEEAIADDGVAAILLICAGRTFISGADIKGFAKSRGEVGRSALETEKLYDGSSKPIIAAIHGNALGGGLEVAMMCHYRIARPGTRFALTEVTLGILPAGAGTLKLPRILGVEKALAMLTTGDSIYTDEALDRGLIDAVSRGESLREDALDFAEHLVKKQAPVRRIRDEDRKLEPFRQKPEFFTSWRQKVARRHRGFAAPAAIVRCVEAAVHLPFDQARRVEVEEFKKLRANPQRGALMHNFLAERAARKIPDIPRDFRCRDIRGTGIVGAGTMGTGIAMCFANAGIPVTLLDKDQESLDRGIRMIRAHYERSVQNRRYSEDQIKGRLGYIEGTMDSERLQECDLIIEAVDENMELKQDIFRRLDRIAHAEAILASNTSGLDLNSIAAVTRRPESVVGLHFFSPAQVMRQIEVVRGERTDRQVLATCMDLARKMNKVPVMVGVCPGFVGNRMLKARTRQTMNLLHAGIMPATIDAADEEFGFAMGPFATMDLAGLDLGWNPQKSSGSTIRERLCEAGRRGQITGGGYYDYDSGSRHPKESPTAAEIIRQFNAEHGYANRTFTQEDILHRQLYALVNEGVRILDEGIALRPGDIDVIFINGYGFPKFRGGPMYWADQQGLKKIVEGLCRFQEEDDDGDWEPAPLLRQLAAAGQTLQEKFAPKN